MTLRKSPRFYGNLIEDVAEREPPHPHALTQSIHEDEGKAVVELASIMTTASNPVSPGPSSPPLDYAHRQMREFIPPTRPSSTPFPQPEHRSDDIPCRSCPSGEPMDVDEPREDAMPEPHRLPEAPRINFNHLPAEIHECVLDHLFGFRVSTTSKSSITRWGTALRHSRRRELSEMALVSHVWKVLIQERLYRHIKLRASVQSLTDSFEYFAVHPHLRTYIKHLELWFPVFHPKYGPFIYGTAPHLPTVTPDGLTNTRYVLPADNCSLEDVFYFVAETLPEVQVMTLEGGERRKAPKVRHWICETKARKMPKVKSVRTLICKGQYNLIRAEEDYEVISSALPNLQEWHALYSKSKSKSYLTMADILVKLNRLTTLNLCLESDYRREISFPSFFVKVHNKLHICNRLATAAASPALEHISYTGRVCKQFFIDLVAKQKDPRATRLRSIDLTVKNCCRQMVHWPESGSGITDMKFINAFEALVLAGIRALSKLRTVEYLRIRYVDLDSPVPPLNPYFLLRNGWCSGVWSDSIVAELNQARPTARFECLNESFGDVGINKDGRMVISPEFPKSHALSLKLSNYEMLSESPFIS